MTVDKGCIDHVSDELIHASALTYNSSLAYLDVLNPSQEIPTYPTLVEEVG